LTLRKLPQGWELPTYFDRAVALGSFWPKWSKREAA
jgi:hypothetical protein